MNAKPRGDFPAMAQSGVMGMADDEGEPAVSDDEPGTGEGEMRNDGTGVTKFFDLGQNFGGGDQD